LENIPQISPSILSADFNHLGEQVRSVDEAGCQVLHLDVMDGHYVPNLSFGPMVVKAVRKMTDMILEAHLMISEPDKYLEDFIKAGADIVLVHPSTCPVLENTISHIHDLGAKAGLVINPDENISIIEPYMSQIEQVLIMSVYPGFGGQSFIPAVLNQLPEILHELKKHGILLEIDGGINLDTIPTLANIGIDRFVAGSAVFNKSASPAENYGQLLKNIIQN
jgi:ribulose-phosphate 3-epimerase